MTLKTTTTTTTTITIKNDDDNDHKDDSNGDNDDDDDSDNDDCDDDDDNDTKDDDNYNNNYDDNDDNDDKDGSNGDNNDDDGCDNDDDNDDDDEDNYRDDDDVELMHSDHFYQYTAASSCALGHVRFRLKFTHLFFVDLSSPKSYAPELLLFVPTTVLACSLLKISNPQCTRAIRICKSHYIPRSKECWRPMLQTFSYG